MKRSVVRSLCYDSSLSAYELEQLFMLFKAGHLQSRYWGKSDHRNQDVKSEQGWKDPHEHFLIDDERFVLLFTSILPWGKGDLGREMALRCFKVIDEDNDGLINFKEFSLLCSLITRGDLHERLRLLYRMHLGSLDDGNSVCGLSPQKELFDVVENALEATEDVQEGDSVSKEDTLVVVPSNEGVQGKLENEEEIVMTPSSEVLEESIWPKSMKDAADVREKQATRGDSFSSSEQKVEGMEPNRAGVSPAKIDTGENCESSAIEVTPNDPPPSVMSETSDEREIGCRPLSPHTTEYILSKSPKSAKKLVKDFVASVMKDEQKTDELPNMSQVEFINLWKSLYSLFRESADKEQELYQAIARAGTLLLQIGDAASQDDVSAPPAEPSFVNSYRADDCKSKESTDKTDDSDLSSSDVFPDEPKLNIQVQGMTLTEALADAQRSLSSSPGKDEGVKSEEYVYVDDSGENRTSTQSNFAQSECEGVTGSSYKEIASCIGQSPEMMYREIEPEAQSSPLKTGKDDARERVSQLSVGISSCSSDTSTVPTDSGAVSDAWAVGFSQFIACVLSEPALAEFFEQRYDLKDTLEKAKTEGLQTLSKSFDDSLLEQPS